MDMWFISKKPNAKWADAIFLAPFLQTAPWAGICRSYYGRVHIEEMVVVALSDAFIIVELSQLQLRHSAGRE